MSSPWLAALAAAPIAWLVVALLRRSPLAARLADLPNERSLHALPVPRIGGLGMLVAVAIAMAWIGVEGPVGALLMLALALALVSLADDVRSLPALVRLSAHVAAAAVAVGIVAPGLPAPGVVAATLALAWMTNLYNFMDGADALAASMAAIGFAALAIAAASFGETGLGLACAAVAAAAAGFLPHNVPPARVFMGDAGAIPLGFLAGAFGLLGWRAGAWPAWFPLLVFSPFVVDASLTLARRLWRRERVWRAHRSHYYQRLVLAGWSKPRLALHEAALMALAAVTALAVRRQDFMVQCVTILAWAALYALLALAVDRRASRARRDAGAGPWAGEQ